MRNDNDSWDIKTSVGATALFVAAARGLAARHPQALAVDQFAEVFCRAAGDEWAALFGADAEQTKNHPLRAPGFGPLFQDFQAARTRYFDDYLCSAADAGVRQVVIVAAGLDSRAYRLAWPDGTVVYELDRSQVLDFKRDVLADAGVQATAERHEVAVDLRDDWASALRENGFDPSVPTAWLVEGLVIYLTPDAQNQLFETLNALSAPGSWLGVEEMATIDSGVYAAMTTPSTDPDSYDQGRGAQWAGLIYNEGKTQAVQWFLPHGWSGAATGLVDYLTSLGRAVPAGKGPVGHFDPSLMSLATVRK
ncbi:class I SAM-dependent methyltransferase [Nocardia sp. NPDC059236]|uniref:class I SAM-dependent methyltransferase n=1 Tax=Nocardia sp. NPDC059236 TaxID=3346783 RepID=UPI00369485FA